MALWLRNYNIVRVIDGDKIVNCTVIGLCCYFALIKYAGSNYKIPYDMIDKVIGHEFLLHAE